MRKLITRLALTTATATTLALTAAASAPSAFAGGKATLGCPPPYQQATVAEIDAFSQPLVAEGYFTQSSLLDLLNFIDHNADGSLCYTVPPGWNGPPATNAAHKAGFVNLVDNKIIKG
jgi:hypothetical protein